MSVEQIHAVKDAVIEVVGCIALLGTMAFVGLAMLGFFDRD